MTTNIQTSIPPSDRLSLKEIRETLYHCRDMELNLLWQRSLLLAGFMTLCFTGYGVLAVHAADYKYVPYIHEYMCGVALVGIILSVIWIYMVKGSKAWYEVYEGVICEIEKETNPYPKYRMGVYAENKRGEYDTKFWNNNAGAFSPSKANILIGWVTLLIWSVCEAVSMYNFQNLYKFDGNEKWTEFGFCVGIVVLVVLLIPLVIRCVIKSRPMLPIKEQNGNNWKMYYTFAKYEVSRLITKTNISQFISILTVCIKFCCIFICPLIAALYLLLVCFFDYIKSKFHKYKNTISQEQNTDKKIRDEIYSHINHFANERLENMFCNLAVEDISKNTTINATTRDTQINKNIDELITNKANEQTHILINQFVKKEIEVRINKKIDELIREKIIEIQQQLTEKS